MIDLISNNIHNYSIYKWTKHSNQKAENVGMDFLNKQTNKQKHAAF